MSQLGASRVMDTPRAQTGQGKYARSEQAAKTLCAALRPSADDDRPLRRHLPNRGASGTRTGGPRCPAGSGTLQQPGEVLVHDKRDARAGEHPDEVRPQAAVEPRRALVLPCVCDRGRDGAVVRAREHRVALSFSWLVCVRAHIRMW